MLLLLSALLTSPVALAQESEDTETSSQSEAETGPSASELERRMGVLAGEIERLRIGDAALAADEGLPSTLMVVVDVEGRIARVELLSFEGPDERRPPASFYVQLHGLLLDGGLRLRRSGVDAVSGAPLSSKAAVEAGRRVLALHRVVGELPVD